MTTDHWFILIGLLMLARGMAATSISRSPFTSAIVYLGVGLILGPTALNLFHFDPTEESGVLEVLTEVAILISLFSAGIKMPVPFQRANWNAPLRLAWISMIFTVMMVAAFGCAGSSCLHRCWNVTRDMRQMGESRRRMIGVPLK